MTRKNLPPLEVGAVYRAADFEKFEFAARSLNHAVTGEDIAILRHHLSNKTILEMPAKDEDLHYLLRTLMEAYQLTPTLRRSTQKGVGGFHDFNA